jgi:hypothetical protein
MYCFDGSKIFQNRSIMWNWSSRNKSTLLALLNPANKLSIDYKYVHIRLCKSNVTSTKEFAFKMISNENV